MKNLTLLFFSTTLLCFANSNAQITKSTNELKAKSIQEKGNLFYQVHQDNSDPNTLILFEGYSDDSALTLHRSAGYYIQAVVEDIQTLLMDREVILTTPVKI